MIIGIQCIRGSGNGKACNEFCRKMDVFNYQTNKIKGKTMEDGNFLQLEYRYPCRMMQ